MAFDSIVRNATLPDGRQGTMGRRDRPRPHRRRSSPEFEADAGGTIDARGYLLAPPFVDCHFHMDATLSLGLPRLNVSGTLLEGIALWGELKPQLTHEAVVERALRYCDLAVSQGLLAIRSHVDVCDDRLLAVEALLDVKTTVQPYLDLQLVAFPQDGYFRSPTAAQNLERALDMGVDVVGGIPHFERTMADGAASVTALCEIAARRGLDGRPALRRERRSRCRATSRRWPPKTQRLGLRGARNRLASDLDAFDGQLLRLEAAAADRRIGRLRDRQSAHQHHAAGPARHLSEAARHDPRSPRCARIGIPVALGQDCVMDPWYGLGGADMLDVAHMAVHGAQMTSREAIRWTFDAVTEIPARILGLEGYGLAVGARRPGAAAGGRSDRGDAAARDAASSSAAADDRRTPRGRASSR